MKLIATVVVAGLTVITAAGPAAAQTASPQTASPQTPSPLAATDSRSPAAVALQTAIERVCLPVLGGASVKATARAAGVQDKDSGWWLPAAGDQGVAILPPDEVNPHVCSLTLTYPAGQDAPVVALLNRWAQDRGLHPVKVKEASQGATIARVTSTWEGATPKGQMAIVLNVERGLDGKPLAGADDQAAVLVSLAPATHSS